MESQQHIDPGAETQTELGDTVQSFFLSPKAPSPHGWIWGAGPVFLLRTGTIKLLSSEKWGAGPTAVALRQEGPWTYGLLVNHIWSFAGDSSRSKVNTTFAEPFLSYTTPTAWTYSMNTESTYDWTTHKASVPINAGVSKVTKIGSKLVSIGGELRDWAQGPLSEPKNIGARITVTLLFPKQVH